MRERAPFAFFTFPGMERRKFRVKIQDIQSRKKIASISALTDANLCLFAFCEQVSKVTVVLLQNIFKIHKRSLLREAKHNEGCLFTKVTVYAEI